MTTTKKIPPIVQIGAWLLSLIVFTVGFWHTHLGLKEMKPFGSEWGGLAIAAIVLLLLLITYWFAVNGKKTALVFYILCGIVFFVCNLNYFYPSYMARTLIKEEAAILKDTINSYATANLLRSEAIENMVTLRQLKDDILKQIRQNNGQGTIALSQLEKFNTLAGSEVTRFNSLKLNEEQVNILETQLEGAINDYELKNLANGLAQGASALTGWSIMDSLRKNVVPKLEEIAASDKQINFDSIKVSEEVKLIKDAVQKINTAAIAYNKGSGNEEMKELPKEKYPRADKLGEIQNTFITIGERIDQISTWAIILLCLFIDLIVPLAIYLLLRKKGDEAPPMPRTKPTSF